MSWTIAGKYVRASATDPDAQAYLQAVEAADGQALEFEVARAIDNFVLCCKQDGIWNAIKASCILAGARTLTGALVPLAGTAPTNFNFVSGDYNRKTGLVGNGSTKYLNSNRNNNADPQNSKHASVYISVAGSASAGESVLGSWAATGKFPTQLVNLNNLQRNVRINDGASSVSPRNTSTGIWGLSRSGQSTVTERFGGTNLFTSTGSSSVVADAIYVFARNSDLGIIDHYSGRLAFYSIGESLDLALLDARVTDLINAFDTAIPS
jgi:hypothetical protein